MKPGAIGSSGAAIFERWSAAQIELHRAQPQRRGRSRSKLGLSSASVKIYRSIWHGWLNWLAYEQLPWNNVTPSDVERFLATRAPSEAGRPAIVRDTMANYTCQRYFRVLQGVYRDAAMLGLIDIDPVSVVEQEGRQPHVQEDDRRPQMLPPGALALLRRPDWLAKVLPMEHHREWWVLRDRACVALTAHCGLTTGELRTLQGRDLRLGSSVYGGDAQARLPGIEPAGQLFVDVRDGSAQVSRSVPVPVSAVPVLDPWLNARLMQLQLQRHRWSLMEEGDRAVAKIRGLAAAERAPLLLASERNAAKAAGNGELTAAMLYRVFRKCLQTAYTELLAGPGEDQYVATGAAIVRNTVIGEWVETCPEAAGDLAGLKSLAPWLRCGYLNVAGPTRQTACYPIDDQYPVARGARVRECATENVYIGARHRMSTQASWWATSAP